MRVAKKRNDASLFEIGPHTIIYGTIVSFKRINDVSKRSKDEKLPSYVIKVVFDNGVEELFPIDQVKGKC
jgi:hypothetical protein